MIDCEIQTYLKFNTEKQGGGFKVSSLKFPNQEISESLIWITTPRQFSNQTGKKQ